MNRSRKLRLQTVALFSILIAPAASLAENAQPAEPSEPVSLDGQTLDPAIQAMLERDAAMYAASDENSDDDASADTAEGRAAIRRQQTALWSSRTAEPPKMRSVKDEEVKAGDVKIPVRIYRPEVSGVLPIIVYYHGGGWFIGGIEASDRSSRQLADDARAIVVSVEYRLSPETHYPAAWNDAEAAYEWAVAEAERLGGAPDQVCVGGDSAGGNMSIVVTARQLDKGNPPPLCQILYYPAVDNRPVDTMRETYRSSVLFGEGFGLDRAFTDYILPIVFPGEDLAQPEISPLFDKPRKVPPTLIATAGFDPLRDSERAYAAKLVEQGNDVIYREFPTLIHGFLQHTAVTPAAVRASRETAQAAGRMAREAAAARAEKSEIAAAN